MSVQALQLCNQHFALNRDVSKDIEAHLFWGLGIVLEAVMFLKLNYKHWDKNTVALAMRNVSSQLAQDRYVKYQKYMDQMADLTLVDEE